MQNKYELLLFDLDNTLFDFDYSEKIALLSTAKKFGVSVDYDTFESVYQEVNRPLWIALEQGIITSDYIKEHRFSGVVKRLKIEIEPIKMSQYYMQMLSETVKLIPYAEELCKALNKKYRLVALTNGLKLVQEGRMKRSGLLNYFETIIISEDVGVSKPDSKIFDIALAKMGHIDKKTVLMIGDSLKADIKGAYDAGIDAFWVNLKGDESPEEPLHLREVRNLEQLLNYL